MTLDARAEAERLADISTTLRCEADVSERHGQRMSLITLADRIDLIASRLADTQPRTVTTEAELLALPVDAAIRTSGRVETPRVLVKIFETWWCAPVSVDLITAEQIEDRDMLPATVLYVPTDETEGGDE